MTFKQAQREEKKITAKRFGMLKENGNGVWIYECKTEIQFGRPCHYERFRGCCWKHYYGYQKHDKSIYPGRKWEGFWLASELTRTDWKVTIISEAVLDTILTNSSNRS